MLPLGAKPVEAYLRGVDLSDLVEEKFFAVMSKKLPGTRVAAVTFVREVSDKDVHGEPKLRSVTIWYPERPKGSDNVVSVDADDPDELQGTLEALDEFKSAK